MSPVGATHGAASLALQAPIAGFYWGAQRTWGVGDPNQSAFADAATRPTDFLLEFDVTYDTASLTQGQITFIQTFVALNSDGGLGGGWTQVPPQAGSSGQMDETIHVSIPLADFTPPLAVGSQWYQVNFGLNNDWGASSGTIYIDKLQLIDTLPVLGDMDCDGDVDFDDIDDFVLGLNDPVLYESIFDVPPSLKGDTDTDGDQDFDDIPGFVSILSAGGAESVPEPSALVLSGLAGSLLVSWRIRRRRRLRP